MFDFIHSYDEPCSSKKKVIVSCHNIDSSGDNELYGGEKNDKREIDEEIFVLNYTRDPCVHIGFSSYTVEETHIFTMENIFKT